MQAFQRIVRDVLVMTAVGASAAVPADSLVGHASFEQIATAPMEEIMSWGLFGDGVFDDLAGEPALEPPAPAPVAQPPVEELGGPQLQLLSEVAVPDPASCMLLLGGLLGWALWRRRVQRRRHAGSIGAYLIS